MLFAAKVNNAPDALRLLYRIEGVELPDSICTSRVVFETRGDAKDSPNNNRYGFVAGRGLMV